MKKMLVVIMVLFSIISTCYAEETNIKILVNGVNVIMVENDKIVKPIEKEDILYVPLEAFLKALNISFTTDTTGEKVYNISIGKDNNDSVDYYSQLSDDEKAFLDSFVLGISTFKNPSSVKLIEVYNDKEYHNMMYYVELSAQNGFGGNSIETYVSMFGIIRKLENEQEFNKQKEYMDFDIALLNKALAQKVEELGY